MEPERVAESDETYLLSAEGVDAVKLRDGLMDVKHLEQVDDDGLELWKPVMKSPLPISAADARAVLAALRVSRRRSTATTYDLADLVDGCGRCGDASSPSTRRDDTTRSAAAWPSSPTSAPATGRRARSRSSPRSPRA